MNVPQDLVDHQELEIVLIILVHLNVSVILDSQDCSVKLTIMNAILVLAKTEATAEIYTITIYVIAQLVTQATTVN